LSMCQSLSGSDWYPKLQGDTSSEIPARKPYKIAL